jgi:amidohydrolase family protein
VSGLAAGAMVGLGRAASAQQREAGERIALTHVTVIDMSGAKPKPDLTVLITGDRIEALGRSAEVGIPAGARVVDLTGKYLIPGLCDMHVHSQPVEKVYPPLYVVNGVTTVRQMGGYPFHHEWRDRIESGALLGPRQAIGSIYIDGAPTQWSGIPVGAIEVKDAAEARTAVRQVKREGADFVKIYSRLSDEAYFAVADEARRQRIPFAGHWPDEVSTHEAVSSGQRTFEHLYNILFATSSQEAEIRAAIARIVLDPVGGNPFTTYMSWFRQIHPLEWRAAHSHDPRKARALFAHLAAHRTWQTPTLATLRLVDIPADWPPESDERITYLPAVATGFWPDWREALLAARGRDESAQRVELYHRRAALAVEMHHAGVPLLAGSDDATPGLVPGFALHEELARLVEAGLTPMQALRTATLEPARYLGLDDSLGTVRRGKLADLVVLDANPLNDIRNTSKIHAVLVRGRLLTPRDRQRILAEIAAAAKEETTLAAIRIGGCCGAAP